MAYFRELFNGLRGLIEGMSVTARYMLKKPVTELYPYGKSGVTAHFKGPIAFTTDEIDGSHKCIACNACIKACPSRCMTLAVDKNASNQRVLKDFKVDYSLCSLCSICIEVCPTDALMHDATHFDITTTSRAALVNDLIQPFRDKGIDLDKPILTPAQKKALLMPKEDSTTATPQAHSPTPEATPGEPAR